MSSAGIQAYLNRMQMEAAQNQQRRQSRDAMLGSGLGTLGSIGGAYLGSPAGSAAISNALGLGGGSNATNTSPIANSIMNAIRGGGNTTPPINQTAFDVLSSGEMVPAGQGTMLESALGTNIPGAETLAGIGSYVAPALGAYGAYDLLTDDAQKDQGEETALQGAASGAAMGSMFGLPGMAIGGALGGLGGYLHSAFGSGGDPDERQRRDIRGNELANFYTGDNRLQFGDVNADVGQLGQGGSYNVDLAEAGNLDSELAQTIGGLNPLMALTLGGRGDNRASDFTGEFANAAMTSDNPEVAVQSAYEKAGYDRDKAYTEVLQMEGLDQATRDAYLAAIDDVFGVS